MERDALMKTLCLLTILFLCFMVPARVVAQGQDRVDIILTDQGNKPVSDVTVTLLIYKFDEHGTTVEIFPSGSCITGQDGRCEIVVNVSAPKDASGFLKGALDLGERGKRSVIWPGGLLEVPITLNQTGKVLIEREAGPFDNDQPAELTIIQPRPPLYWWGIFLAGIVLIVTFFLYRRAKGKR